MHMNAYEHTLYIMIDFKIKLPPTEAYDSYSYSTIAATSEWSPYGDTGDLRSRSKYQTEYGKTQGFSV